IAVLFLIPGFLYTRLGLPPRNSVAGYLKGTSRIVAQVSILSMATLSASIAANSGGAFVRVTYICATILPILATLLLVGRMPRQRMAVLRRLGAPTWAV